MQHFFVDPESWKHIFKSEIGFMIFICTIQKHTQTQPTNPCGTGSSPQHLHWTERGFSSTRHGVITREFSESVYRCLPPAHWQPGPEDIKGRLLQRQMGFFGISLGRGHGLKRLRWILETVRRFWYQHIGYHPWLLLMKTSESSMIILVVFGSAYPCWFNVDL